MRLPEKFLDNMKKLLPENEYEAFLASYDDERLYGIRANLLKIKAEDFSKTTEGFVNTYKNVPWCKEGFYYKDSQPGQLALYHAGVYYIQEPSAMYPGGNVPLKQGDYVLDICAAPGGKSTQLAARLGVNGFLVSNDISEERTKALVKNLQMAGVTNAIVTNETPENLAERFPDFFDVIVVDAPCSGEGMFRKDENAVSEWESYKAERCRKMQNSILESVHIMLKEGGILSYSTCTFNKLENEDSIRDFMEKHPEYHLIDTPKVGGVADAYDGFDKAARLWPHKVEGEGHFTAFLKKGEGETRPNEDQFNLPPKKKEKDKKLKKQRIESYKLLNETPVEVREFYEMNMTIDPPVGRYFTMGTNLYYLPIKPPNIDGLKVPMAGVHMGSLQYGKLTPAHRIALIHKPEEFKLCAIFKPESETVSRYLKGETITLSEEDKFAVDGTMVNTGAVITEGVSGLCAVAIEAGGKVFVLGLGNLQNGNIKNLYPKGWRRFN